MAMAAALVTALGFVFPKDSEKYPAELFWSRKTFAPAKYDVVLMGDSRVYRALSPGIMESQLPELKVLNFAYSNGGLNPVMFDAAEKKLARNNHPKIIVLGVTANSVTGYSAGNQQYIQELTRPREEVLERFYLNPVRYWFSATSPGKLKQHFFGKADSAYYRNTYFMDGYVESEKYPVDTTAAISSYIDDFKNYKVDSVHLNVLYKQVRTWSESGITVVGFVPPVSQPMRMLEDTLGLFDEAAIKAGFEKASGHWIGINPDSYKTYDGSHLTIESARRLSGKMAASIKELIENNSPANQ